MKRIVHGLSSPTSFSPAQGGHERLKKFVVRTHVRMFSLVLSALASPNTRLRIYATQFSTKQPRHTVRTRGDEAIVSRFSAHLFEPDFSARRVIDEPGNSFLSDRTCGMSRVKNELRHRKIVRDGAQIFFGYVFAHPDSTRRGQKADINAIQVQVAGTPFK